MKGTYFMKTNHLSWKYTIVVIVFGFYLTSCADNSTTPVPKTEYPTKIVGRWQGTVGDYKETMVLNADSTFFCKLYPMGFIANTLSQGVMGMIHGTWKINGAIITLRITGSENEHLINKVVSTTIQTFNSDRLVLKSDRGETSPFQRIPAH